MSENVLAKILDYSVGMSKTNNLKVNVLFQTLDEDPPRNFTWSGSLLEGKARDITVATLVKLGLATTDLTVLNKGLQSNALNAIIDYELVLKEDTYNGVTRLKVNYIKLPGEGDVQQMDEQELKAALNGTSLKDELAAKLKKHPPSARVVQSTEPEEDPFI